MFESILIRQTQPFGTMADAGLLAEALLFYRQTLVAATTGDIAALLKVMDPQDLIGLIEDGHLTATLIEDILATYTENRQGVEGHKFVAIELFGHQDRKAKYSREEKLELAIEKVVASRRDAKKIARRLVHLLPHRKINALKENPAAVTAAARRDLDNPVYVRDAVDRILRTFVPDYARSLRLQFDVLGAGDEFVVGHNIDLTRANAEFHERVPKEIASITTAFLMNHLLSARGDMLLASQYMSEIVTSPVHNALIELQFDHLLIKRERNVEQIRVFQDAVLDGRSLREAINSGGRSFSEFRKLLETAQKFRSWLHNASPDQRLIAEYERALVADTWINSLPAKAIRFAICSVLGAAGAPVGIGAGALDAFLVEKILKGWRPHHFVQGPLLKFVGPDQ